MSRSKKQQLAKWINAALERIGTAQGSDWRSAFENVHRITNAFGMEPRIEDGKGNSISEVGANTYQFNGEPPTYSDTEVDEQIAQRQLQSHRWYCHAPQEEHPPTEDLLSDSEISSSGRKETEKRQDPRS